MIHINLMIWIWEINRQFLWGLEKSTNSVFFFFYFCLDMSRKINVTLLAIFWSDIHGPTAFEKTQIIFILNIKSVQRHKQQESIRQNNTKTKWKAHSLRNT